MTHSMATGDLSLWGEGSFRGYLVPASEQGELPLRGLGGCATASYYHEGL